MLRKLLRPLKRLITKIIEMLSGDSITFVRNLLVYRYVRSLDFDENVDADRSKIWELTLASVGTNSDTNISYFEFGVYNGESMKWWTSFNRNPNSRFVGFDSFEGLPEKWLGGNAEAGAFRAEDGRPEFDDSRVSLIEGWFSDTLWEFFKTYTHDDLSTTIVMFDADIFTSTVAAMANMLVQDVGSSQIWLFDEFVPDEARAMEIFSKSFALQTTPLVSDRNTHHVSFLVSR